MTSIPDREEGSECSGGNMGTRSHDGAREVTSHTETIGGRDYFYASIYTSMLHWTGGSLSA